MGFFKSAAKGVNYAVTLGGSHELEIARTRYQETYSDYKKIHDHITVIQQEINQTLTKIGRAIEQVQPALKMSQRILKIEAENFNQKNSNLQTLKKLTAFNTSYNSAVSAGFGGLVGGTSAAGAWVLVGFAGSASTGTAISVLSGAAAYNATLAWFGGGALAAGGAGMSGGMMVLGGIVAAPVVYFAAKKSYAKAKETDLQNEKLKIEIQKINKLIPEAEEHLKAAAHCLQKVDALSSQYTKDVTALNHTLHPFGIISCCKQILLRLLGRAYAKDSQKAALSKLSVTTEAFLKNFSLYIPPQPL